MNVWRTTSYVLSDVTTLQVYYISKSVRLAALSLLFQPFKNKPKYVKLIILGSYRCVCPYGYAVAPDRMHCEDIDECSTEANDCRYDCKNLIGSFM